MFVRGSRGGYFGKATTRGRGPCRVDTIVFPIGTDPLKAIVTMVWGLIMGRVYSFWGLKRDAQEWCSVQVLIKTWRDSRRVLIEWR